MANTAFIAVLMIIFVVVAVVLPRWGVRRAIPFVIRIFRNRNAVGKQNAKTIDELGLKPTRKGMIETMFGPRDYRLAALRSLVKANVVQMTEDRKFYLSEENLAASKWKGY
jgi:hypothetical protein